MAWGDSLPSNFSWLRVNAIAGSACPAGELEVRSLAGVHIKHVITLSPEALPHSSIQAVQELCWTFIPVENFRGGSLHDFAKFFDICEQAFAEGVKILVHCKSGRGRTGMFLAAYLIKYEGLRADSAIRTVRSILPRSIETREQELSLANLEANVDSL